MIPAGKGIIDLCMGPVSTQTVYEFDYLFIAIISIGKSRYTWGIVVLNTSPYYFLRSLSFLFRITSDILPLPPCPSQCPNTISLFQVISYELVYGMFGYMLTFITLNYKLYYLIPMFCF